VGSSKSVTRESSRRSRWRTVAATAAVASGLVLGAPAAALAAGGTVTPFVSCYWSNPDGSITVSVGYTNSGTTTLTYPVGTLNYVTPSPQDRGQPSVFLPGTHNNVWAPTVTAADFSGNAQWYVNGVPANVSTVTACATKPVSVSGSTTGYLTATSVIVGAGLLVLASPRRRRTLTKAGRAATPVTVSS
jgi:hypothetical protein